MAAEQENQKNSNRQPFAEAGKEEAQRRRGAELVILTVLSVCVPALVPGAVSFGWRDIWVLPFLFAGTGICWVLYIRRLMSERDRLWLYAVCGWGCIIFDGVHPTALYGIALMCCLLMVLFFQTDERGILHVSFLVYLFVLGCQIVMILRGESVISDPFLAGRLTVHTACVLLIWRVGLGIIRRRGEDRASANRIIEELHFTRRRTENFMANVAHELRTPVNVVTGLSSVMETRLSEEEDRKDAAHILEAGKRLSDQVDDILDFTEIETGRFTVAKEPYRIAEVVGDAINALDIDTREHLPEIIVDVDANIPPVLIGDARRIKSVLTHLADNAVKFTRRGGVYLNVYRVPKDYGINLCIEVKDTGIGMSRQVLERLREGVYQQDAERNRENTGFGLGLRIVYGIVHAMGGFVQISSAPGQGTEIRVSLPQEIAEGGRCMEVKDPSAVLAAFYQRQDKFANAAVLDYYLRMIGHVIRNNALTVHRVTTLKDCREMLAKQQVTHLFLSEEEYREDPAYFDACCDEMQVIVVAQKHFRPSPFSRVTLLRKPLYAFPLVDVLNAESEQEAKAALYTEAELRFDGLRVLVVDDEEMNLLVARKMFAEYGMEVKTASSGPESIERIRKEDFDLVFMDHMMPGMDGVEAQHRIRDFLQGTGRRTMIVALTANTVSGAREMMMEEGFDGFVAKPIERQELERTVSELTGR